MNVYILACVQVPTHEHVCVCVCACIGESESSAYIVSARSQLCEPCGGGCIRGVRSSQLAGREEESPALSLEIQTLGAALTHRSELCVYKMCVEKEVLHKFSCQSLDYRVKLRKDSYIKLFGSAL